MNNIKKVFFSPFCISLSLFLIHSSSLCTFTTNVLSGGFRNKITLETISFQELMVIHFNIKKLIQNNYSKTKESKEKDKKTRTVDTLLIVESTKKGK
jgi:hypothetical protein